MSVAGRTAAPASRNTEIRGYGSRIALAEPVIGRAFARPVGSLVRDDEIDSIFKQPILRPSLRGANGSRECAPDDRLREEAIHSSFARRNGLLRFARNDG